MLSDPVNQNLTSIRRFEGLFFNKGPFYYPGEPILKYKTLYIDLGSKVYVI